MYSVAKFAIEGYCEALRMELRGSSGAELPDARPERNSNAVRTHSRPNR
jgi:hypothetical protein